VAPGENPDPGEVSAEAKQLMAADRYEDALVSLIKAKQAGKPAPKATEAKPSNIINLMDALRRSVKSEKSGGTPKAAKKNGGTAHRAASPQRPRARKTSGGRTRMKRAG
jgi:DNA end-binding protein Ku